MAKVMKLREVEAALRRHDCKLLSQDGIHTKWSCPCGQHTANIPRHKLVSPGVVRSTQKRMECLNEGWLQ